MMIDGKLIIRYRILLGKEKKVYPIYLWKGLYYQFDIINIQLVCVGSWKTLEMTSLYSKNGLRLILFEFKISRFIRSWKADKYHSSDFIRFNNLKIGNSWIFHQKCIISILISVRILQSQFIIWRIILFCLKVEGL